MTITDLWYKLSKSRKYRNSYALAFLKRSVPFQISVLRKKHCGSQQVLAERSGLTQGVVSRAEDPDYGNLTLNTIGRIASGLDMAFVGRFVPFSDLVRFSETLSEEEFESVLTFDEEAALSAPDWAQMLHVDTPKKPTASVKDACEDRDYAAGNVISIADYKSQHLLGDTEPIRLAAAGGGKDAVIFDHIS